MRKSPLAVSVALALLPGVQIAASRYGPISPYQSWTNRGIYYRMIGQDVVRARSIGKTLSYPFRYSKVSK